MERTSLDSSTSMSGDGISSAQYNLPLEWSSHYITPIPKFIDRRIYLQLYQPIPLSCCLSKGLSALQSDLI